MIPIWFIGGVIFLFFFILIVVLRLVILRRRARTRQKTYVEAYNESVGHFKSKGFTDRDAKDLTNALKDGMGDELGVVLDKDEAFASCPADRRPPCGKGLITKPNSKGQLCCYIDPKTLETSKREILKAMVKEAAIEQAVNSTMGLASKVLATRLIKKVVLNKARKVVAKMLGKSLVKVATKIGTKMATLSAKLAAKTGLGPAGWAMLAFDVMTAVLDVWDPAGYNKWVSNTVNLNMRNIVEASVEEQMRNEGDPYPMLAPYMYNLSPEMVNEMISIPAIMEYNANLMLTAVEKELADVPEKDYERRVSELYKDESFFEKHVGSVSEKKFDAGDFDKDICTFLKDKKKLPVKWVDKVGCSLNENGCHSFNSFYASKPEPKKDEPDERLVAVYTNTYRVRDSRNMGSNKSPNMLTKKFPEKVCLISPMTETYHSCQGKGTWNPDLSLCDFSAKYCTRYGLKRTAMNKKDVGGATIHNCKMYPGQKVAEIIFGTTLTRSTIRAYKAVTNVDAHAKRVGNLLKKTFPAFNKLTDNKAALLIRNSAIVMNKFGMKVAMIGLKTNYNTVKTLAKLATNPEMAAKDVLNKVKSIVKHAEKTIQLGKTVGNSFNKHVLRTFTNGYNNFGKGIVKTGLKTVGKTAKTVGKGIVGIFT